MHVVASGGGMDGGEQAVACGCDGRAPTLVVGEAKGRRGARTRVVVGCGTEIPLQRFTKGAQTKPQGVFTVTTRHFGFQRTETTASLGTTRCKALVTRIPAEAEAVSRRAAAADVRESAEGGAANGEE